MKNDGKVLVTTNKIDYDFTEENLRNIDRDFDIVLITRDCVDGFYGYTAADYDCIQQKSRCITLTTLRQNNIYKVFMLFKKGEAYGDDFLIRHQQLTHQCFRFIRVSRSSVGYSVEVLKELGQNLVVLVELLLRYAYLQRYAKGYRQMLNCMGSLVYFNENWKHWQDRNIKNRYTLEENMRMVYFLNVYMTDKGYLANCIRTFSQFNVKDDLRKYDSKKYASLIVKLAKKPYYVFDTSSKKLGFIKERDVVSGKEYFVEYNLSNYNNSIDFFNDNEDDFVNSKMKVYEDVLVCTKKYLVDKRYINGFDFAVREYQKYDKASTVKKSRFLVSRFKLGTVAIDLSGLSDNDAKKIERVVDYIKDVLNGYNIVVADRSDNILKVIYDKYYYMKNKGNAQADIYVKGLNVQHITYGSLLNYIDSLSASGLAVDRHKNIKAENLVLRSLLDLCIKSDIRKGCLSVADDVAKCSGWHFCSRSDGAKTNQVFYDCYFEGNSLKFRRLSGDDLLSMNIDDCRFFLDLQNIFSDTTVEYICYKDVSNKYIVRNNVELVMPDLNMQKEKRQEVKKRESLTSMEWLHIISVYLSNSQKCNSRAMYCFELYKERLDAFSLSGFGRLLRIATKEVFYEELVRIFGENNIDKEYFDSLDGSEFKKGGKMEPGKADFVAFVKKQYNINMENSSKDVKRIYKGIKYRIIDDNCMEYYVGARDPQTSLAKTIRVRNVQAEHGNISVFLDVFDSMVLQLVRNQEYTVKPLFFKYINELATIMVAAT